jgi:hypothetical protein
MITNPIVHPRAAILASLLIGALAIAASMLRPDTGQRQAEQFGFGRHDASSADALDRPRPAALASGRVATQNEADAGVAQVLEAVRASLRRNDLASAQVLLDAEQTLYKDDPRITALRRELQSREEAGGQVLAVEPPVPSPAASHSSRSAPRYAARAEQIHSASTRIRERASSSTHYAEWACAASRSSGEPSRDARHTEPCPDQARDGSHCATGGPVCGRGAFDFAIRCSPDADTSGAECSG